MGRGRAVTRLEALTDESRGALEALLEELQRTQEPTLERLEALADESTARLAALLERLEGAEKGRPRGTP